MMDEMIRVIDVVLGTFQKLRQRLKTYRYHSYLIDSGQKKARNSGPVFGQCFEDSIVALAIGSVKSFIDIGANDGISLSNTYFFAENGASGICFEPNPEVFHLLGRVHKKNKRIVLINEAIGETTRESILYGSGYGGLLSSIVDSPKINQISSVTHVTIRPLTYWLQIYPQFKTVDLLSIDVEGAEKNVLEGIDFDVFEAKICVVEIDNTDINEVEIILQILCQHGYRPFARNHFNCFLAGPNTQVSEASLDKIKLLSNSIKLVDSHTGLRFISLET